MIVTRLEKITVYVSKEMKKYLQSRDVSMSQWIRTWIRQAIHRQIHLKNRYHNDKGFRNRRHESTRNYKRKVRGTKPENYRID
jgi:hypothetical protein